MPYISFPLSLIYAPRLRIHASLATNRTIGKHDRRCYGSFRYGCLHPLDQKTAPQGCSRRTGTLKHRRRREHRVRCGCNSKWTFCLPNAMSSMSPNGLWPKRAALAVRLRPGVVRHADLGRSQCPFHHYRSLVSAPKISCIQSRTRFKGVTIIRPGKVVPWST